MYDKLVKKFQYYYDNVSFSQRFFDREVIESNLLKNDHDTRRIVSLLIFFKELEARFKEKIEV
jgi:hypothetical protein